MFGLGRKERARKALKSALGIYLPGDAKARDTIINRSDEATDAALTQISKGTDAYYAAALLVSLFIRDNIESSDADVRQRFLRRISDGNAASLPRMLQFATHMVSVLARLETGRKPIVPDGTTAAFLDSVAGAFSPQDGVKKKIASFLYKCAAQAPEDDDAETG